MADNETPAKVTSETKTETVATPKKNSNKTLWIVLGVILVVFVLIPGILLTAGGLFVKSKLSDEKAGEKLAESLVERASGGKVDVDADKDGNFSVKSKDGDSSVGFGSDQKLPDDFPKGVSNYLSEKSIVFVLTSKNENKQTWSVTTTVDKSFADASSYFEGKIKDPEYTEVTSYGFGNSKTLYGKKDNYSVSVTVAEGSDGSDTTVSYIVTEE